MKAKFDDKHDSYYVVNIRIAIISTSATTQIAYLITNKILVLFLPKLFKIVIN